MKKLFIYAVAVCALSIASCKGNSTQDSSATDSGQTHVGNENPTDSAKYPTTPIETGGKDSSGNGQGSSNAPKDTLNTTP